MRVSEKWLRERVNLDLSLDKVCEQLTNAGLEVDSVDAIGPDFSGVVVGEIVSVEKHPNSDHLTVCTVSTGDKDKQYGVVCGAPNVRVGLKSAYAQVGAELSDEAQVSRVKIHGVVSEGTLCSSKELGIDEDHSGILDLDTSTTVGQSVADVLDLYDNCIEIDLTPNRGDCFSMRGVSRELSVINAIPMNEPSIEQSEVTSKAQVTIELAAPDACPIYLGRIIENVDVNARVPLWLTKRLSASGIRSINAIVDILNYVMLELGQPMHAFDLDKVRGGIEVRYANPSEKMTLLDGAEVELDQDVLLITSRGKPVAIAGVIGGLDSGVSEKTRDVLLECAFFNPGAILGTARKYGLQTDASTRYERGVDYALQDDALNRATSLILEIAGGSASSVIDARSLRHVPSRKVVSINKERLTQLIGEQIPDEVVYGILERLGFEPKETTEVWTVTAPTYRFDISIEEDLVEEVCRIYGYDRIRTQLPETHLELDKVASVPGDAKDLRSSMRSMGYIETISYSFIDRAKNALFVTNEEAPTLQNPMSTDREVMRCSLLAGLLDVVAYNVARQHDSVRVFEHGQCFDFDNNQLTQRVHIAGVAWGRRHPEGWANSHDSVDFFDLKGQVEELLPRGEIEFRESKKPWLKPGHAADIYLDGVELGTIGQINTEVQSMFDIEGSVFAFECDAKRMQDPRPKLSKEISNYPSVRRDLALILDESVTTAQIQSKVSEVLGELLTEFKVFDVYRGDQLGTDKKSLAIGMTLQDTDRTLLDSDTNDCIERLISELQRSFGAQLR